MDELLGAVQQRKTKINEVMETILKLKVKRDQVSQSERSTIYAIIRKLKEEEKNRTEKENWIVSIMRNTKQYNEDQMNHIFLKTNDIMKLINSSFVETPYQVPTTTYQFLETYYNLHQTFFTQMNQEYQLKIQYRQSIKQGNINLITDLLKALLASSRKILKDNIDDLAYLVNKDLSPEKQKIIKKLVPDPLLEHLRTRSSTQNGKKDGTVISMTNSVVQSEEQIRYSEKKDFSLIKDKLKQQQRRFVLQPRVINQEILILETPVNQLKVKFQQNNNNEKNQFSSLFQNINLEDLDEQNICVLDYQTIKRQSQNFEEFRLNFDSLLDKIKMRNTQIQQSVTDYNQYVMKKCCTCSPNLTNSSVINFEIEFFNIIKEKYDELTNLNAEHQQSVSNFHFCKIFQKPMVHFTCQCLDLNSKCELSSNPIKNKIVIRKSFQSIKKSNIQQGQNTFTSKNLIDQIKKERTFNQSIILEDSNPSEIYKNQNNSGVSPLNNSILQIRRLEQSQNFSGNTQYKLYAHKLSNDFPSFKPTSLHHRAQSANGDQLSMIPPLNLRNCAE